MLTEIKRRRRHTQWIDAFRKLWRRLARERTTVRRKRACVALEDKMHRARETEASWDILFLMHYLSGWNKTTKDSRRWFENASLLRLAFQDLASTKRDARCAQRRSLRASKLKTRLSNWLMEKSSPLFADSLSTLLIRLPSHW